jgi:hypothetical protein
MVKRAIVGVRRLPICRAGPETRHRCSRHAAADRSLGSLAGSVPQLALPRGSGTTGGEGNPGAAIEVDRLVSTNGLIGLAGRRHPVGSHFAGRRLTVRLDRGLLQLVDQGSLLRSLPNPLTPRRTGPAARRPPRRATTPARA